jgi:hypothetical protein
VSESLWFLPSVLICGLGSARTSDLDVSVRTVPAQGASERLAGRARKRAH